MPQRRQQTQYRAPEAPKEAFLGDYSALAQQFLKKRDKPIYSMGQGVAEVLGDVGEAYFARRAAEKDQEREDRDLSAVAMAQQFASDPNLTRVGANDAMGRERTIANSVFDRPADPNERYAGAMAKIQDNPRAQIAAGPGVMDLAKQFTPPTRFEDVDLGNGGRGQRDPRTNQLTQVVAPQRQSGPEPSPLARLMAERDALPPTDPRRSAYDAAITQQTTRESEPLVEVADPNDPTRGIMVPRSQAAGRGTVQTVRDRMPRVKTYWAEDGSYQQLDSNSDEDQKIIREQGLTDKAPTDSERTAKGFLDRMESAEKEIDALLQTNPQAISGVYDAVVNNIPLVGNKMVSDDYQTVMQKVKDWARAKLRKESGAVIGDQEALDEFKTYFPLPGDNEKTIAGKKTSRDLARKQFATSAGILGRPSLRAIESPAAASDVAADGAPAGIDPNIWQHMTPQERALWLK